jgi:hypothetical protein
MNIYDEVQRRYDICKACERSTKERIEKCKACGCIILFKILPPSSKCPIGKWENVSIQS